MATKIGHFHAPLSFGSTEMPPKSRQLRARFLKIRVTEQEHAAIENKAAALGITVAALLRRQAFPDPSINTSDLLETLRFEAVVEPCLEDLEQMSEAKLAATLKKRETLKARVSIIRDA